VIKLLIKSLLFLILLSCEEIPKKKLSTIVEKSNEIIQKTLKQEPAIITKQESTIIINQEPSNTTIQQPSIIKKKNNIILIIPAFLLMGTAIGIQTKSLFKQMIVGLIVGVIVYFFLRYRNKKLNR